MIQVKFKNLEKSDLATQAVQDRISSLTEKFQDLQRSKLQITLEMENSPTQAGPDLFTVKLHITKGKYDGITVQKSHSNMYVALAEVVDHMLESLNRLGDKKRVKNITRARKAARNFEDTLSYAG